MKVIHLDKTLDNSHANRGEVCGNVKHALRGLMSSRQAVKALSVTTSAVFLLFFFR